MAKKSAGKKGAPATDPAVAAAKALFDASGKSLVELAQAMGYTEKNPRQCAWHFLNRTYDPTLSTIRRFARAMGVPVESLVNDGKKKPRPE